jgi:hypothetical protein
LNNCDRAAVVTDGNTGIANLDNINYFKVKKSLCGMGDMDFYKQADGSWKFCASGGSGGNGNLQGTSYTTKTNSSCSSVFFFIDRVVCYYYICNA